MLPGKAASRHPLAKGKPIILILFILLLPYLTLALSPANADAGALASSSSSSPSYVGAPMDAAWLPISGATNQAPAGRVYSSMTYDKADGYTVLFGGMNSAGVTFSDTWAWVNGGWRNMTAAISPSARAGAAFGYSLKGGYGVLFGGLSSGSFPSFLNDTWRFSGGDWSPISTPVSPSPRSFASFAYDPTSNEFVLFGGLSNNGALGDTWIFNGESWVKLTTSQGPTPRYGAGFTFDPSLKELVLFGGQLNSTDVLSDTWIFAGGSWSRVNQSNQASEPTGRAFPAFTYDKNTSAAVLFGGRNASGCALQDTWLYQNGEWVKQASFTPPPPLYGSAAAFNPLEGNVFMFGGSATEQNGTGCSSGGVSSGMWELYEQQLYAVTFIPSGLALSLDWNVTFSNITQTSIHGQSVTFLIPPGRYTYEIIFQASYNKTIFGTVTVVSYPVSVPVNIPVPIQNNSGNSSTQQNIPPSGPGLESIYVLSSAFALAVVVSVFLILRNRRNRSSKSLR